MEGEISKSMGVDTKPAHKLDVNGFWVLVDPNAPVELVRDLKSHSAYKKAYHEEVFQNDVLREKLKEAKQQLDKEKDLNRRLEVQIRLIK